MTFTKTKQIDQKKESLLPDKKKLNTVEKMQRKLYLLSNFLQKCKKKKNT